MTATTINLDPQAPGDQYLPQNTSRKTEGSNLPLLQATGDGLREWMDTYQQLTVTGVRSQAAAQKIALHLLRFHAFFLSSYGHERLASCLRRDVLAWQTHLREQGLAASTVNNHLASLSAFTTWVQAHHKDVFAVGNPTKGIGELALPPLEPRALTEAQVRSLKSICDRLPRFHQVKGRRWQELEDIPIRAHARPWRDRAIVFVLLSTGLRREELVQLDLNQVEPNTAEELRAVRKARLLRVVGKGKTERTVFLSQDARDALADYIHKEREHDVTAETTALFLSACCLHCRAVDGRLSTRAVNLLLEQIGKWHDAESQDVERHISPLRPHDLRHTFAFHLAQVTGADAYELERRLGHRSQRYIQRYTNPPEATAAGYVERF